MVRFRKGDRSSESFFECYPVTSFKCRRKQRQGHASIGAQTCRSAWAAALDQRGAGALQGAIADNNRPRNLAVHVTEALARSWYLGCVRGAVV